MLPAERRDVLEQGRIDGLGFPKQIDGALQIDRVPQRDGGNHQIETAGAILGLYAGTPENSVTPTGPSTCKLLYALGKAAETFIHVL